MRDVLSGKTAIVTAGGQGVGRGASIALARAGANVIVSGRTVSKCAQVVDEINGDGGRAVALECDVRNPDHVESTVATALETFGSIDVLVNAADDQRLIPFMEIDETNMLAGFQTGVMGTIRFSQACVPHMTARGGGAIVNVASGAGLLALAGMGPYSAMKEAIRSLTRTAAVELGPLGIRVNVICPTAWAPSFQEWAEENPTAFRTLVEQTPLRRIGDPVEDVGAGIVFLCSEESRYVTGSTLMLDGGSTYLR